MCQSHQTDLSSAVLLQYLSLTWRYRHQLHASMLVHLSFNVFLRFSHHATAGMKTHLCFIPQCTAQVIIYNSEIELSGLYSLQKGNPPIDNV